MQHPVIFLHLEGNPNRGAIPFGLIGLINNLKFPVQGLFQYELTEDIIQTARVIIIDLHWYFNMHHLGIISRQIKTINKECKILIGGYTATIFHDILLREKQFDIDAVLLGDGEGIFSNIIEALLNNEPIDHLPNIATPTNQPLFQYLLNKEDFDNTDYITLDWFPALLEMVKTYQSGHRPTAPNTFVPLHPFIPVFKGCSVNCVADKPPFCYHSMNIHQKLTGRSKPILRSFTRFIEDLNRCENIPWIHQINIVADFFNLFPNYLENQRLKDYDLRINYDFCFVPNPKQIKPFFNKFSFNGLNIPLRSRPRNKEKNIVKEDFNKLIAILQSLNFDTTHICLMINSHFGLSQYEIEYINTILSHYPVDIYDTYSWEMPVPLPKDTYNERKLEFTQYYNITRYLPLRNILEAFYPKFYERASILDDFIFTTLNHQERFENKLFVPDEEDIKMTDFYHPFMKLTEYKQNQLKEAVKIIHYNSWNYKNWFPDKLIIKTIDLQNNIELKWRVVDYTLQGDLILCADLPESYTVNFPLVLHPAFVLNLKDKVKLKLMDFTEFFPSNNIILQGLNEENPSMRKELRIKVSPDLKITEINPFPASI